MKTLTIHKKYRIVGRYKDNYLRIKDEKGLICGIAKHKKDGSIVVVDKHKTIKEAIKVINSKFKSIKD